MSISNMQPWLPRVVIVGAGFGGLQAAKKLAGAPLGVTLIDRRNYHLFQPLLYQVATAALSPADIAAPIRGILRDAENCSVILAKVTGIDAQTQIVMTDRGGVPYDYLVLAAGASTTVAAAVLVTALLTDDFRFAYVARNSYRMLAPAYKVAALW